MTAGAARPRPLWSAPSRFGGATAPAPAPAVVASATGARSAAAKIERLLAELEELSSRRPALAAILAAVDDPASGAGELATAVSTDPGLSARLMRLANSAYFGLSGRVSTLRFAITAVGFATVRALAVSCASGVTGSDEVPEDFWDHACAHAVGAGAVARPLGAHSPEAFCAGLLADLGRGLLFRADPSGYVELMDEAGTDPATRLVAERDHFGMTHPQVSARVLAAWSLPKPLVTAVAEHHVQPSDRSDPLVVSVRVGEEIAQRVVHGLRVTSMQTLSRGRIADDSPVQDQVAGQAGALLAAFAGS